MFTILIIFGSVLEAMGDVLFRKQLYWIGGPLYVAGSILWAVSLRYGTLSKGIVLFMLLNVVIAVLAGVCLLGERLTVMQCLGIALGLVAVALLN